VCTIDENFTIQVQFTKKKMSRIEIPFADDLHIHLRQGPLMASVVPQVRKGGCKRVYVMVPLLSSWHTHAQTVAY